MSDSEDDIPTRLLAWHEDGFGEIFKQAADEIEKLREQLEKAMQWQEATLVNIDLNAFYVVKDNGSEWRDFDLHIWSGRMVAMKLRPDYVRGRPQWIAKINPPSVADLPSLSDD